VASEPSGPTHSAAPATTMSSAITDLNAVGCLRSDLYVPGQPLCASCDEAEPFMRELADLSDKVEVVVHDVQAEPARAEQ
jgi:hypothetical protein